MRWIDAIGLFVLVSCTLAAACFGVRRNEPAPQTDPPATAPAAADPHVVQWRFHCDLTDGRRLITDGSLLVEARYFPDVPVPERAVPPAAAERLLKSETDHEFGMDDLSDNTKSGHYRGGKVLLNRKYVELLRGSSLAKSARFRAKGPNDPVLILDGDKVVGVVMPVKQ
jgi:hypothetical protein